MAYVSIPELNPQAVLVGTAAAANIGANGNLVLSINGAADVTVALLAADTPSAVVTKINTALGATGLASLSGGVLNVMGLGSVVVKATSTAGVLTNLALTALQTAVPSRLAAPAYTQPVVHLATLRTSLKALAIGGTKGTLAEQAVRAGVSVADYTALVNSQTRWSFEEVCLVAFALPATITVSAA